MQSSRNAEMSRLKANTRRLYEQASGLEEPAKTDMLLAARNAAKEHD